MSPTAFSVWRAVALVVFIAAMTALGLGLNWFVNAIPAVLLALIVGGGCGVCAGILIGEAAEKKRARLLAEGHLQAPVASHR